MKSKKQVASPAPELPEPRAWSHARMKLAEERAAARGPRVEFRVTQGSKGIVLGSPHTDEVGFLAHSMDALGTSSPDFMSTLVGQLLSMAAVEADSVEEKETKLNAAVAAVEGVAPGDEVEAMLAVQMVGTHSLAMSMLRRAKNAQELSGMSEYGTLATKLLRTYTAQLEVLAKVRRGGEQKVVVEHVHVYPGGQAIVGTVNGKGEIPGGGLLKSGHQPHAIGLASQSSLLGADPEGDALPSTRHQEGTLSDARRGGG